MAVRCRAFRVLTKMKLRKQYIIVITPIILIAILVLYSIGVYFLCLYSKLNMCLNRDGPIFAFENGEMEVIETYKNGALYKDSGFQIFVRDHNITISSDYNLGYSKFYKNVILESISIKNPLHEAINLLTPFDVESDITFKLRTEDEVTAIKEGIKANGVAYLEEHKLNFYYLEQGYLIVN